MPTKMTAHLLSLLEIDFLYPPTKSLYDSTFALPTKVARRSPASGYSVGGRSDCLRLLDRNVCGAAISQVYLCMPAKHKYRKDIRYRLVARHVD